MARERRQKALEDARDEREAEREANHNMDDAIEHNSGQYMFASAKELQRQTAQAVSDLLYPLDDLTAICHDAGLYDFTKNMDELLVHIDAMEEEHRVEALHPVMAALPKRKRPTRKSTRKGAGKRKMNFGDTNNDRWQQFPDAQAAPTGAAIASQPPTLSELFGPSVRRPTIRSTV